MIPIRTSALLTTTLPLRTFTERLIAPTPHYCGAEELEDILIHPFWGEIS